ncbi:hypothetical protein BJ170DRAFT_43145 [Xylariales sp. AK1849]|nr:hypothetical protein BJ170DRAFT_43145 [Xylariales sp. AK1849]
MSYLQKFRSSRSNYWFQRILRIFQFLSSIISLGLFSSRLAKIIRLTRVASKSNGAVEGILAAAVLYTLVVMLLSFCLKRGASTPIRWLLVVMDILFLGAFIAVAYLTRPNGGDSGPCRNTKLQPVIPNNQNCNLPWGTFILAIISTVLHALTAAFNELRDHHKAKKNHEAEIKNNPEHGTRSDYGTRV